MIKEGLNVEFKREYTKEINKTVVAFINTNGGKIYIGIDDDGTIVGIENPDKDLLMLTNSMRDGVKPDVTLFTTCEIEIRNGKKIIVIEVQKGVASPYYLSDKGLRPSGVYVTEMKMMKLVLPGCMSIQP